MVENFWYMPSVRLGKQKLNLFRKNGAFAGQDFFRLKFIHKSKGLLFGRFSCGNPTLSPLRDDETLGFTWIIRLNAIRTFGVEPLQTEIELGHNSEVNHHSDFNCAQVVASFACGETDAKPSATDNPPSAIAFTSFSESATLKNAISSMRPV